MRRGCSRRLARARLSGRALLRSDAFSRDDRVGEPVGWWGEGADPPWVVGAGRVVGEVEVEHELAVLHPEVGPLDGVEQVATCPVGLFAAGGVAKGKEQTASTAVHPVQIERELFVVEVERDGGETR